MEKPEENKNCYASSAQREVLLHLIANPIIEESFFLTGGTALSVFYLHHRVSNDLDLFALEPLELSDIDFWVKRIWLDGAAKIKEGPNFLSFLIKEVRVDFVIDPLSIREERQKFRFENGRHLMIDTVDNIASNKFCTIVSRVEPKDFIDFYYMRKIFTKSTLGQIYNDARKKEALFDDPPTAAFQIEEGLMFLKENQAVMPNLMIDFNERDFFTFYNDVVRWLYGLVKI
jgi:hypothetical protein